MGTLIGRVVDATGCGPLSGVELRRTGAEPVRADRGGRFRIGALPAGPVSLTALRVGYRAVTRTVTVAPPELAYVEFRLDAPSGDFDAMVVDSAGRSAPLSAPLAPPRVALLPAQPRQGSIVRVRLATATDSAPVAELAGEPLHFVRVAARSFEALAAAPVDAPDTLMLTVGTARPGGLVDTMLPHARVPVAIARGDFSVERLRVAPEFGREPDLALAERLERESEKARDAGCRAHHTPRLWTAPFVRPRPGRVTSAFGRAREYNGTVTSRHTGTDFAGATGAPVLAVNRGVVRLIDRFYLGGNVVYLDHGAGVVSAYMHLSRTSVAVGDTVARGQRIGRVGSTGRVTGPHLHWVVRYGRTSVDPMSLLAVAAGRAGSR